MSPWPTVSVGPGVLGATYVPEAGENLLGLENVRRSATATQAVIARWETFVQEQFDRLEAFQRQLAAEASQLAHRHEALVDDERVIDEQWQRLTALRTSAEQSIRQAQAEAQRLAQARSELQTSTMSVEVSRGKGKGASKASPKDWQRERAALERELQAAREQIARLSDTALELAESRQALIEARQTIARQQHRLALAKGYFDHDRARSFELLQIEHRRLVDELAAAQRWMHEQREQTTQQQRQMASERSTWSAELRKLREALEQQSTLLGERVAARIDATGENSDTVASDARLGDLLRQLDALQDEFNQRPAPRRRAAPEAVATTRQERS